MAKKILKVFPLWLTLRKKKCKDLMKKKSKELRLCQQKCVILQPQNKK